MNKKKSDIIHVTTLIGPLIMVVIQPSVAMIGYDCASKDLNVTTISLRDTEPCPDYQTTNVTDSLEIQVLQERETYDVHVYQCLIELDYHVTHCGMHSHASEVEDGWGTVLLQLTANECKDIHKSRSVNVMGHKLIGLKRNATQTNSLVLAGGADRDGGCTRGSLNIGSRHWVDVYATAKVRIVLKDLTGIHRIIDDKVVIPGGISCKHSEGFCVDAQEGFITWENKEAEKCDRTSYVVLYRGLSTKLVIQSPHSQEDAYTMYSIKDGKFLATLVQKSMKTVCGIKVYTTDHPKLLVHEIRGGSTYFKQDPLTASNMDIFLYVNAKFTHVENHMRRELTRMYETMVREQCELRREVLKTQLTLATMDPVEFAYLYMKKPGYTGIVMGEQIHLVQCNPVFVTVRKVSECYNELPVNYTNRPMFMSPRSHIIQKTGTPIACSMIMQPAFSLSGTWFAAQNGLSKTQTPFSLSPVVTPTWTYSDAGLLATEGVYSSEDLDKLRSHLMFPSERKAIAQTVSAAINQDTFISDTTFFNHLLTKEAVESSFKKFMDGLWGNAVTFGNIFSGIFGIMLVFKILKWACDTVVHSRGLYEIYGCGWQLLASSWDAMTTYFLSPNRVEKFTKSKTLIKNDEEAKMEDVELMIPSAPNTNNDNDNNMMFNARAESETSPTITPRRPNYPVLYPPRSR